MRVAPKRPTNSPRPRLKPATAVVESPPFCAPEVDGCVSARDELEGRENIVVTLGTGLVTKTDPEAEATNCGALGVLVFVGNAEDEASEEVGAATFVVINTVEFKVSVESVALGMIVGDVKEVKFEAALAALVLMLRNKNESQANVELRRKKSQAVEDKEERKVSGEKEACNR